jgi:hypothetical protein
VALEPGKWAGLKSSGEILWLSAYEGSKEFFAKTRRILKVPSPALPFLFFLFIFSAIFKNQLNVLSNMIREIHDPKEKVIKIQTTSVLISRQDDEKNENMYRTAVLRLFKVNNPHKRKNVFPTHVFRFSNIEKVRVRRLNVSYYLEGPDIVVNDLEELYITHEDNKLVLKGYQLEVEHRNPDEEKQSFKKTH